MLKRVFRRIAERLQKRYQVEVIDYETLSRSRRYMIQPLGVILASVAVLLVVVIGTGAIFVFTPGLHRLIPNYKDPDLIQARMDSLLAVVIAAEERQDIYDAYARSLRQVTGMEDTSDFDEGRIQELMATQEANLPMMPRTAPDANLAAAPVPAETTITQIETVYVAAASREPVPVSTSPPGPAVWLQKLFQPVEGQVLREYNAAALHYGVDIVAEENTLIRAAADGFVVLSEYSDNNGWVIGIATEGDIVTFYKHNSRLLKDVGSYVYAGEPIAVIGNSGENSSGMHLHFELWHNGKPIDPAQYLALTN